MRTLLRSSLAFALLLSVAEGQDKPKPWSSVNFKVLHEKSAAEVTLQAESALTEVNLSLIGKSMDIPEAELEGIDNPNLASAQLLFGEDYYGEWKEGEEPIPPFIVELYFGERSKFGKHPTVRFVFHSGSYQFRTVSIQKTATQWEEFTKYPGEDATLSGTATRPADPGSGPATE